MLVFELNMTQKAFWKDRAIDSFNREEWESLCDHCAKCCLHKIEDIDTQEIHFTNVRCRYLDEENCQCTEYENRSTLVPECVTMTYKDLEDPYWLPNTCAYRLIAENKDLPEWHPLITGDPNSVKSARQTITGRVINETVADELEYH